MCVLFLREPVYPFALALVCVCVCVVFKGFYGSLHAHRKVTYFFSAGVSTHPTSPIFVFICPKKECQLGGWKAFSFWTPSCCTQAFLSNVPLAHCGWIHAVKGMGPQTLCGTPVILFVDMISLCSPSGVKRAAWATLTVLGEFQSSPAGKQAHP